MMLKLFKNVKGVKNFQPCKFDVRVKNEGKFISLSITDYNLLQNYQNLKLV